MKYFGFTLLVVGFLWIAYDVAEGFTDYQYVHWIWQTQHLPAGDMIKRTVEAYIVHHADFMTFEPFRDRLK